MVFKYLSIFKNPKNQILNNCIVKEEKGDGHAW